MRNPTKVVMRHLPPNLTEEEFLEVVSPFVTSQNYVRFCSVDKTLGGYGTTRAYIDFISIEALFQFKEQFDNYVFVDSKGNETYGLVEYAVNQKIPESFSKKSQKTEKRRPNTKLGSISKDPDYLTFEKEIESNKQSGDSTSTSVGDAGPLSRGQALMEANLEEIKAKEKEIETGHGSSKDKTPLLLYLEQKRNERQFRRDEERRRIEERKKEIRARPNDLASAKRKERIDREKNRPADKNKLLLNKFEKNYKKSEDKSSYREKHSANKEVDNLPKPSNKEVKNERVNKSSRSKDENVKPKEGDTTINEASAATNADSASAKEVDRASSPGKSTNKSSLANSAQSKGSREFKPSAKSYAKSRAAAASEETTKERSKPHGSEESDDKQRRRPDSYYGNRSQHDYDEDYARYGGRGGSRGGGNRSARSYHDDRGYEEYDYGYEYRNRRGRDYEDSSYAAGGGGARRSWEEYGNSYSRGRGDRGGTRHKPTSYSSSRKDSSGRGAR